MEEDAARLGVIADRLGYQLRRLDMAMMGDLHAALDETGLTPARASALIYIARNEGCDQAELARALGVNGASTMATVDRLVLLGAIERAPGRDRRSNALRLTTHGIMLRDTVVRITGEHDARFFGVLDEAERQELRRLIAKTRTPNSAIAPRIEPTTRAILRRIK